MRKQESQFTGKYSKTVFQTLWFAYRPYLPTVAFVSVLGLIGRILLLGNANVVGYWVDSLCNPDLESGCRVPPAFFATMNSSDFILFMLGISTLGFCLIFAFRVLFSRLSAQAVSQIYDETTYRTSRQPMSFFDQTPTGRIVTRFSSDYGNVFRLFGGPLAELFSICFDLIAMFLLIALASPFYLPILFLVGALDYAIYRFNLPRMREARRDLSASRSPSIAHFAETAQGASSIRTFLKQRSFSQRFLELDRSYLKHRMTTTTRVLGFSFQINCMTALFLLGTGAAAYFLLQAGHVTVGSIGVAFSFVALSGNTTQMFFEWMTQFDDAMVGVERLDDYLQSPIEPGSKIPEASRFPTPHPKRTLTETLEIQQGKMLQHSGAASVHFDQVSFQYRPELPMVLKHLNFEISAGEKFGIIGRTGSGKSSLIQALFYMYPLSEGRISINQMAPKWNDAPSPKTLDLEIYRKSLAYIPQDPTLFRGTLRDNLEVMSSHTDEELYFALQKVGLSEWANESGLRHPIEEKGRNLSLGERQLLCMARCLLQDAPVVVMDEATSSIDPQSEEILVKATEEFFKGKTQILIAHRLSTLLHCDRILWLQNGQIKMLGKPSDVLPVFQKSEL